MATFPQMAVGGNNVKEMIDFVNESGLGSIGTVDDAVAQIDRLIKQSNGGFGCYMLVSHDWANPAPHGAAQLIGRHVFRSSRPRVEHAAGQGPAEAVRPELAAKHLEAVQAAGERYQAEIGDRSHKE